MAVDDLRLANGLTVPGWAMTEVFVLAGGPGGQNVNKNATAVQLRLQVRAAQMFSDHQIRRILKLAGSRATKDGEIIIEASQHRRQERNREAALERLKALLDKALEPPPPPRKKTRPTRGSVERRLKAKTERGETKKLRGAPKAD